MLAIRFQHSHPFAAGIYANVGIKGPLANMSLLVELGFDIRYSNVRLGG
jgi:hypothetical protein